MLSGSGSARKSLARLRPSYQNNQQDQQDQQSSESLSDQTDQPQISIPRLCPGKRLVMEKFFTPVNSAKNEINLHKHHHHHQHHHEEDCESHSCSMLEDNSQNTDESHRNAQDYHQHSYSVHDNHQREHHYPHHHQHQLQEKENHDPHHTIVTLSQASSSSLSSSSSSFSSFTSWYAETSAPYPMSVRPAELLHSLSCSNILEVSGGFQEKNIEPTVFAAIKHGRPKGNDRGSQGRSEEAENLCFSSLNRGHSRSEEGLLQRNDDVEGRRHKAPHSNHGVLYKTVSLNRSLAFSEEAIMLGFPKAPNRAVSSSQLPGKGILKNKEPWPDIRKAISMEVISPRVANKQSNDVGKDRGVPQAKIEKARENFVQGKLQFSAFLDEITRQVISPSHLNVLGVNNGKATGKTSTPAQYFASAKPQLPSKKHSSGDEKEQWSKLHRINQTPAWNNPQSRHQKLSDRSNPNTLISHRARNHHRSPPPCFQQPTGRHPHPGISRKNRTSPPTEGHEGHDPHLVDGSSTSPELVPPKHTHHRKQRPIALFSPPQSHAKHGPQQQHHHEQVNQIHQRSLHSTPVPPAMASGIGPQSECPSTKWDSCRSRDTSLSSEYDGRYYSQAAWAGHPQQRVDIPCDSEQFQALKEENADLHHNFLQTVVCIENLEAELQWTKHELSHAKEKYKSLLEMHTGEKEANNLLGEHLHIVSDSWNSERNCMLNRIALLTSELEDAHRTIAGLETINVPCLIRDILEKHLDPAETLQKFLNIATPASPSIVSPTIDNKSYAAKATELPHDWLKEPEAVLQRVTAFLPWKQERKSTGNKDRHSEKRSPCSSSPLTVANITTAICNKMVSNYATTAPCCVHPKPPQGTDHDDSESCLRHSSTVGEVVQVGSEVTYLSAQKVLDDVMHQLKAHKEAGWQNEADWERGRGDETGREME